MSDGNYDLFNKAAYSHEKSYQKGHFKFLLLKDYFLILTII